MAIIGGNHFMYVDGERCSLFSLSLLRAHELFFSLVCTSISNNVSTNEYSLDVPRAASFADKYTVYLTGSLFAKTLLCSRVVTFA